MEDTEVYLVIVVLMLVVFLWLVINSNWCNSCEGHSQKICYSLLLLLSSYGVIFDKFM
jgi:hypothetical protein